MGVNGVCCRLKLILQRLVVTASLAVCGSGKSFALFMAHPIQSILGLFNTPQKDSQSQLYSNRTQITALFKQNTHDAGFVHTYHATLLGNIVGAIETFHIHISIRMALVFPNRLSSTSLFAYP